MARETRDEQLVSEVCVRACSDKISVPSCGATKSAGQWKTTHQDSRPPLQVLYDGFVVLVEHVEVGTVTEHHVGLEKVLVVRV